MCIDFVIVINQHFLNACNFFVIKKCNSVEYAFIHVRMHHAYLIILSNLIEMLGFSGDLYEQNMC